MQLVISSNLNAIYEKEEEEITETIKNTSTKQLDHHGGITVIPYGKPKTMEENHNNPLPMIKSFSYQSKESMPQNTLQQTLEGSVLIPIQTNPKAINMSMSLKSNDYNERSNDTMLLNSPTTILIYPDKSKYFKPSINLITYKEVFNYYSSLYIFQKAHKANQIEKVLRSKSNICCLKKIMYQYINRYRLDEDLKSDKELLLYISAIPYDSNNKIHLKMIMTIYQHIEPHHLSNGLNNDNKEEEANAQGQGQGQSHRDQSMLLFPKDKGGIYAIIQMLFIIERYPAFVNEVVALFNNDFSKKNYFIDVSSSITALCLKYVNENELNVYFNQKKNIFDTLCEFYIGFISQMKIYLSKITTKPYSYTVITNAFEKTRVDSIKTPSSIFWKFKQFKEMYQDEGELLLTRSCAGSPNVS